MVVALVHPIGNEEGATAEGSQVRKKEEQTKEFSFTSTLVV